MADQEIVIKALIEAEDKSQRAFDDATRRIQELERVQTEANNKINASQTQLANGQTKSNLRASEFVALAKQAKDASNQLVGAHKDQEKALHELEKTQGKLAAAQERYLRQTTTLYQSAGEAVGGYVGRYLGFAAVVEVIRRSINVHAEFERSLQHVGIEAKVSGDELDHLGERFEKLAGRTGKSAEEHMAAFRVFRDQIGGGGAEVVDAYEEIAAAARVTGVSTATMAQTAVQAMKALQIPITEIRSVLNVWTEAIPASMADNWLAASSGILGSLRDIGYAGPEAAKKVAAEWGAAAGILGSADKATNLFNKTLEATTDIGTMVGRTLLPEAEKRLKAGEGELALNKLLYEEHERLGLYDADLETRQVARAQFRGKMTDDDLRAQKDLYDAQVKWREESERTKESIDSIRAREAIFHKGTKEHVDELNQAFKELYGTIGATFGTKLIQDFARDLRGLRKDIDDVKRWFSMTPEQRIRQRQNEAQGTPWQGPGGLPTYQSGMDKEFDPWTGKEKPAPVLRPFIRGIGTGGRGRFATGGEFEVKGQAGVDQQPVGFMATPGERVAVTTPGQESLQLQQDKADQAMRDHFSRFHSSAFTKTTGAPWWPSAGVREPGQGGAGASGASSTGGMTGTPGGTTSGGDNKSADSKTNSSSDPPGTGNTPLKTPDNLDPNSPTGPAQDLKTAVERGYLKTPDAAGSGSAGTVDRSSLSGQLTPELVSRMAALTTAEVGGDPERRKVFLATLLNRTLIESGNINKQIGNGYYPKVSLDKRVDAQSVEDFKKNVLEPVMRGEGGTRTHNASNERGNPVADNAARRYGPGSGEWVGSDRNKEYFYSKTGDKNKLAKYLRKEDTAADPSKAAPTVGTASSVAAAVKQGQALDDSGNVVESTTVTGDTDYDANMALLRSRGGHDARDDPKDTSGRLHPVMAQRLASAVKDYEKETGQKANIGEMFRDQARQARYRQNYERGGGGLAARPGPDAPHQGRATDVPRGPFRDWLYKNADKYKVEFLKGKAYAVDPVHVQIAKDEWDKIKNQPVPKTTTKVAGPASTATPPAQSATQKAVEERAAAAYKKAEERYKKPDNKSATAATSTKTVTDKPATGTKREDDTPVVKPSAPVVAGGTPEGKGGIGSRQKGGDVTAGQPYLVGEDGPETFVPGQSGAVRPDEWEVRKQRALGPGGGGFPEWSNRIPKYGEMSMADQLRSRRWEMERNQKTRDAFDPIEEGPNRPNPNPGQIGGFNTQTGRPLGTQINYDDTLRQQRELRDEMSKPIRPQMELPRAGPIRQRMSRHVEAQRERDVGRMSRHAAHSDIGFV